MNSIKIFLCENSIDGIFTAIYQAWSSGFGHANIKIEEKSENNNYTNIELFSDYTQVHTDYDKAIKVSRSIKNKISDEAYEMICRVALSNYQGKGDLIYRFLILGFHVGASIVNHLSNEIVNKVFKINRYVNNEAHHFLGFVRFSEQENNILTSVIHPKNNVLSLIVPHFVDRLPLEKFAIIDGNRNTCALHIPHKQWVLVDVIDEEYIETSLNKCKSDEYKDLWKIFFDSISIKERINPRLQRNNIPLRFRDNMPEFIPKSTNSILL